MKNVEMHENMQIIARVKAKSSGRTLTTFGVFDLLSMGASLMRPLLVLRCWVSLTLIGRLDILREGLALEAGRAVLIIGSESLQNNQFIQ